MKRLLEYIHFVHSHHKTQDDLHFKRIIVDKNQSPPPWPPKISHRCGWGERLIANKILLITIHFGKLVSFQSTKNSIKKIQLENFSGTSQNWRGGGITQLSKGVNPPPSYYLVQGIIKFIMSSSSCRTII